MKMTTKQYIMKICPLEDSFQDNKTNIKCPVANCDKTVFSSGSLRMHLSKSHGICETPGDKAYKSRVKVQSDVYTEYHCPYDNCIYNEKSERHFTSMANLKQHYMKVHAEKKFKCSKCGVGFGREVDKTRHESGCGMTFTCTTCQCTYISREALLTHCLRTKHPVPEEHIRKKTDKKINSKKNKQETSKNNATFKDQGSIPVILLPVPSDSAILSQNQLQPLLSSSLNNSETVPRSSHATNPVNPPSKSKHLIDHGYQFSGDTDACEEEVTEIESNDSPKNDTRHNTVKTPISIAPKPSPQVLNSGMQTQISVPPQKKKKKSIAQTQTSGDFILKQAMASANIQIDSTSVGTQVTPKGKGKSVDMQVQVTPKSRNRKRGRNTVSSLSERCSSSKRKLYRDSLSDLGVQTDILPFVNRQNASQNTIRTLTAEMGTETPGPYPAHNFLQFNQSLVNSSSVQTDTIGSQQSNRKANTVSQGFQCTPQHNEMTSLGSQFPVVQNERISTGSQYQSYQEGMVSTESQSTVVSQKSRFQISPSNDCQFTSRRRVSSSSMTDLFCSQTVGVQTYADFILSQSDNSKSSIGINTEIATDITQDKSLQNKCVGNDTAFSSDSIVQTVGFDFLANSPDPQTEVMNIHTQTVDLDIESLESLVSSIETQTCTDLDTGLFSLDVQTQTQNSSSANTQTLFNTSMDFISYPSSDTQTQTYNEFPEFIELLSSATQTLDYGFFEDAPLSLINIETQTGMSESNDNYSKYSFGTQTSVFQENTISSPGHSNIQCNTLHSEVNINRSDQNSTVNKYPSEQMEFLVSEVLEMIPAEPVSFHSHDQPNLSARGKNRTISSKDSNRGLPQNVLDNECSSATRFSSRADCDINTVDNSARMFMDSGAQTQFEKCLTSNSECQTWFSANIHPQTQTDSNHLWIENVDHQTQTGPTSFSRIVNTDNQFCDNTLPQVSMNNTDHQTQTLDCLFVNSTNSHTQTSARLLPQVSINNTDHQTQTTSISFANNADSHTQTSTEPPSQVLINHIDHQTQTLHGLFINNSDSHTQTSARPSTQQVQINNIDHQTQTAPGLFANNTDHHTRTGLALTPQVTRSVNNIDHQTQAGPGLSSQFSINNTDSHTQTNSRLLVQDLTNSQTQTSFQTLQNADLTDSHTQTTWKELNDLLSELDH